jgi:serine/threonine protein kinase
MLKSPPRVDAVRFIYSAGDRPLDGYTIKRGIGRGGFGEVYYGTSDGGKEVALKLVQRNLEVELRGVGHCLNLKHPNLVGLYDIRQAEDGGYWVVMEYVAGDNLADVIDALPQNRDGGEDAQGRDRHAADAAPGSPLPASCAGLPLEEGNRWIEGICAGVAYLHDRGIVHRDLKPANIFMEEGTVKIGDYGLSKFITASRRSGQTESVGTVHYMAPEIAGGRYGKEIDIYAAGVILYEMLSGNVPFEGESVGEILMKHLTVEADVSALPEPYRQVVARALAKDPEQRFASISEMVRAIRGEDVPQPMLSPAQQTVAAAPLPVRSPTRALEKAQPADLRLSVPVSLGDVYGGLAEAHGILRLADDMLHLEYTVKDSLFGVIRSRVKRVSIPLSEVVSVEVKTGLMSTVLRIGTSSLSHLEGFPEAKSGALRLRVVREQRHAAHALADVVNRRIGFVEPVTVEDASAVDGTGRDATDAGLVRFFSTASRLVLGVVLAVGVGLLVSAIITYFFGSALHRPPPEVFLGMGAGFFTAGVAWHALLSRHARTPWLGYPIVLAYGTGAMLMLAASGPTDVVLPLGGGALIAGLIGLVLLRKSRPVWLRIPLPLLTGLGCGLLLAWGSALLVMEKDPAIVLGMASGIAVTILAVFWMLRALPYMWRAGVALAVPMGLGVVAYWAGDELLAADEPFPLLLASAVCLLGFAIAALVFFLGPLAVKRDPARFEWESPSTGNEGIR